MPRFDGGGVLMNSNRARLVRCRIPIGATGAIGAFTGDGVKTVVRTATGNITITYDRGFSRYLGIVEGVEAAASATAPVDGLVSADTSTVASTGVLQLWTALAAAPTTPADVASGTIINVLLIVSDSDH